MSKRFKAKKFLPDSSREEIEKFVKSWFTAFNFAQSVTFETKDLYYFYLDLIPTITSYIERFIKAQLKSGKRHWVIITHMHLCEVHRKFIDFHHWQSCQGVGDEYRHKGG